MATPATPTARPWTPPDASPSWWARLRDAIRPSRRPPDSAAAGINRHVRGGRPAPEPKRDDGEPDPWREWRLALKRSRTLAYSVVSALWGGVAFGFNLTALNSPRGVITCATVAPAAQGLAFLPPCLAGFNNLAWGGAVAAFLCGALVGSLLAARLAAAFGRKWTLVLTNLAVVPGHVLVFFSVGPWMFALGRLLLGVGGGSCATVVSVYLAEVAPAASRGAIGATYHLSMTVGMLLTMILGNFLSTPRYWRVLLAIGMVFSAAMVATMPFAVESPRWLVFSGRFAAAKRALRKLRGIAHGEPSPAVDAEFAALLDGLGVRSQVQDAARAWFEEAEKAGAADAKSGWVPQPLSPVSAVKPAPPSPPSGDAGKPGEPEDTLFTEVEDDVGLGPETDELFGLNHHAFEEEDDGSDSEEEHSLRASQESSRDPADPRRSMSSSSRRRLLGNGAARSPLPMRELLTSRSLRKNLFLVCMLQVALPLCGIAAINMYSTTVFSRAFPQSTSLMLTAILGPVLLLSSLLAIPLADRAGRKPLLVASFAGMALCCAAMAAAGPFCGVGGSEAGSMAAMAHGHRVVSRSGSGLGLGYGAVGHGVNWAEVHRVVPRQAPDSDPDDDDQDGDDDDDDSDADGDGQVELSIEVSVHKTTTNMVAAGLFVAFAYLFVALFSGGLGAIGVMILPELIPLPAVMSASSLASGLHWIFSILVSFLIPTMLSGLGTYTFVVFGGLNLAFLAAVLLLMKETKGYSIDVLTAGLLAIDG
ncbi:major facilitator superfamily domain-containing protein [Hyaloraphidium curvatum]|nr:major facilitator superfamily domain-containing protein [Hyaloraphidium curvatum]